ncbi:hypothetical protein HK098_002909 [Nowakowskiella sp. JEL0407]|nr:hypothetical protein HK098_002909 [Nowakowskiella sp. JEL0407]
MSDELDIANWNQINLQELQQSLEIHSALTDRLQNRTIRQYEDQLNRIKEENDKINQNHQLEIQRLKKMLEMHEQSAAKSRNQIENDAATISELRKNLGSMQTELDAFSNEHVCIYKVVDLKNLEIENKMIKITELEEMGEQFNSQCLEFTNETRIRGLKSTIALKDFEIRDLNSKVGSNSNLIPRAPEISGSRHIAPLPPTIPHIVAKKLLLLVTIANR